ncbi:hypothetical protein [Paenibacillus lentus]|uniref:Uncharacterized protein n=1 Tax=Paenibacillus lentus TaxID=1338368 RepID=A0A3Q8SEE3_9BACL|nr:hypothetical protein [Paenibacillus lentus]AZK48627.1 hypothetical protein EIM92_22615 [Paenibacillus lentus]
MLRDKDKILLCELASTGDIARFIHRPLEQISDWGKELGGNPDLELLISEITASPALHSLSLQQHKNLEYMNLYVFADHEDNSIVVAHALEHPDIQLDIHHFLDEVTECVEHWRSKGNCVLTGMRAGGYCVSHLAERLEMEATVFAVPTGDELPGRIRNLVAEHDPVGAHLDQVTFVKQQTEETDLEEAYFKILEFDSEGNTIPSIQSDYSKFVSWFYDAVGTIRPDVWHIFFGENKEEEAVLDYGLYSLFLKMDGLTEESVGRSIEQVLRYTEQQLEKNRSTLQNEFIHIKVEQIKDFIRECGEQLTNQAVDMVYDVYRSVESILAGAALFAMNKNTITVLPVMESFNERTGELLDREIVFITNTIEQEFQNYMDNMLMFPEISLEW